MGWRSKFVVLCLCLSKLSDGFLIFCLGFCGLWRSSRQENKGLDRMPVHTLQTIPQEPEETPFSGLLQGLARAFADGCCPSRAHACATIGRRSTTSSSRTRGAALSSSATIGSTSRSTATRRTSGAPSGTKLWEIESRACARMRTRGPGRRRRADDDAPSWGISIRYIGNNKPEVQKKLSKGYI